MSTSDDDIDEFSKLRWRCRRGVKELDVVLERFLHHHYKNADTDTQDAFKSLLELEDPIFLDMLINHIEPQNTHQKIVMKQLRNLFAK